MRDAEWRMMYGDGAGHAAQRSLALWWRRASSPTLVPCQLLGLSHLVVVVVVCLLIPSLPQHALFSLSHPPPSSQPLSLPIRSLVLSRSTLRLPPVRDGPLG